jgi:hypothetical protein
LLPPLNGSKSFGPSQEAIECSYLLCDLHGIVKMMLLSFNMLNTLAKLWQRGTTNAL